MEKALVAWLLLAAAGSATAPSPTEVVQASVEEMLLVVQDSKLAGPGAVEQRRLEIRRLAGNLVDFAEMARRSLGEHWNDLSSREREEFVLVFTDLLWHSYLGMVENYSGERIIYVSETVKGPYATVRSKVIAGRDEVPLEYRLHLVGSRWAAYDILVEGVSLVSLYRSQFNRVIKTSSYGDLIQKMRFNSLENSTADRNGRSR